MSDDNEPAGLYARREPRVERLPRLLAAITRGALRIPSFQRGFRWRESERLDLFDSIAKGFPIGTFMIWSTSRPLELGTRDVVGPLTIPPPPSSPGALPPDLLIDGQQRSTTLCAALAPPLPARWEELTDLVSLTEAVYGSRESAERWAVFYNPTSREFHSLPRRGALPQNSVPLYLALQNIALMRFLARRSAQVELAVAERRDAPVEQLSSRLKDYGVPVIPVVTDELRSAIESFERVNRPRTPLTQFDFVHALGSARSLDFAASIRSLRAVLEAEGWAEVSDDELGYVLKLSLGLDVYSSSVQRFVDAFAARAADEDQAVGRALARSLELLRSRLGVCGVEALPYSFQLVLITDVLHRTAGHRAPDPTEPIARWFWATTLTEHFRSQRRIGAAHQRLLRLCAGDAVPPVDDAQVEALGKLDLRRARSKGFLLRYARHYELLDVRGKPMGALEQYGLRGRGAVQRLVPKKLLVNAAPELADLAGNFTVGAPLACEELSRRLTSGWAAAEPSAAAQWAAVCASHAIDERAAGLLAEGDYAGFVRHRHAALAALETEWIAELGLVLRPERADSAGREGSSEPSDDGDAS